MIISSASELHVYNYVGLHACIDIHVSACSCIIAAAYSILLLATYIYNIIIMMLVDIELDSDHNQSMKDKEVRNFHSYSHR